MRNYLLAAGLMLAAAVPTSGGAHAADAAPADANWAVIVMSADVASPADVTWARIGGDDFCALQRFFAFSCTITRGTGDVGSVRSIGGRFDELLVAKTRYSLTYAQPASAVFYHGTETVEPVDAGHSRIVYTLVYDQAPLKTPEAQAANRESRRKLFQAGVDKMKAAAEAP